MSHEIDYRLGGVPDAGAVLALRQSTGDAGSDTADEVQTAVANTSWVATAWEGNRLVGLARVLSDGVWAAYVLELLVHPDYHHQGVGKELVDRYEQAFGHFRHQLIVTETDWVREKFMKRGFHDERDALSRRRPLA